MRLSKIKLAGFKSFVEPTTIAFPGDYTGIIGPNGCGKSNVIDAVRWVMGESSAKQLRGDSMDDVIFNGSSSRPQVSRASVDLFFDNSERTLSGQYANYAEICLRREVTRDGQSHYYLNGARCRRRDIADIFLGTGLGPRSYAIIEQGMISRIIDAKPEELRVYLEEAAGITKYKERRRETENRIGHTRENMERLDDVREEVTKQLAHLKRQAAAAERYKELKQQQRQLNAELLALRWRELNQQMQADKQQLQQQQNRVDAVIAEQRSVEASIEQQRQQQTVAQDHLNTVQGDFYRLGSEISRLEQSIHHYKQTRERQLQELQQLNEAWQELQQHVDDDNLKLQDIARTIADKQPQFDTLQATQQRSASRLAAIETAMQDSQQQWETFNRDAAAVEQTVHVEQTRQEQLLEHIERLQHRLDRLLAEQQNLSADALEERHHQLLQATAAQQDSIENVQSNLHAVTEDLANTREQIERSQQQLDAEQNKAQQLREQIASEHALQQAALGKDNQTVMAWLEKSGLDKAPRLGESIRVTEGWEQAVEVVLGDAVEAVCVDSVTDLVSALDEFDNGRLLLLEKQPTVQPDQDKREWPRLADKITADINVYGFLAGVYICESLPEALRQRTALAADESLITPQGVWLGPNWMRVTQRALSEDSVLGREQRIQSLTQQFEKVQLRMQNISAEREQAKIVLAEYEQQRSRLQGEIQTLNREHTESRSELAAVVFELEQLQRRREQLVSDIDSIQQQLQADHQAQQQSQHAMQAAQQQTLDHQQQRQQLQEQRQAFNNELETARRNAQQDKEALHQIALNLESMRSTQDLTGRHLERMQQQLQHLKMRRDELNAGLQDQQQPVENMESELKQQLAQRVQLEKQLGEARVQTEELENQIRALEAKRSALQDNGQELRQALEQQRLAAQETKVRCQTLEEQLLEGGFIKQQLDADQQAVNADHEQAYPAGIAELFAAMPEDAEVSAWNEQVQNIDRRIQRMGPINLAAIDEHQQQSERKEYLDAQHADLCNALETLEAAMAKIDRETRSRFKDTFDQVNGSIQEMFPRLFGGGQAYIEMTGDNLLTTGIAIMARPPGKRVSNIHLLSGGEKALTAVAMVFAIFQLNPAPFCMLDEVDAPLDEANVGRFCQLVKTMSDKVQFIVITHNKTTMEVCDQLVGVTMREAGVSRIVAVDVDEAARMAAA